MKVIILTDKVKLDGLKFGKNEKLFVIGQKNAPIPMEIAQQLFEASAKLLYVERGTAVEFAYELGKLSKEETITEIITDIEDLKLLTGLKRAAKKERKSTRKVKEDYFPMNPPEENLESSTSLTLTKKKARPSKLVKSEKPGSYSNVKKSVIDKILKENNYNTQFSEPIMEVLKTATDVTLSLQIRTELAKYCVKNGIENTDICAKIEQAVTDELQNHN